MSDGARILMQLNNEATQLIKLEPGTDAQRLRRDAEQLFAASVEAAGASRGVESSSHASLVRIQDQFQPILDRMNDDNERAMERRSEQRIRALVDDATDVVTLLGHDLRVRWQAASISGLLGVQAGSQLGTAVTSVFREPGAVRRPAPARACSRGTQPAPGSGAVHRP